MSLTQEQQEIAHNPYANKLVVALPGSGKTHTIVYLAKSIVQDPNARVLNVTFTNSSSKEMAHRINEKLSPSQAKRVAVRTFAKIMLEQFKQTGDPRKVIMGAEYTNYVHRLARKKRISPFKLPQLEMDMDIVGRNPLEHCGHESYDFWEELQSLLKQYNRIDLSAAAHHVIESLRTGKLTPLPYTHFIVDEYQDTDTQQFEWLQAHKSPDTWFTVVGDDDQSIYGWRGAEGYANMQRFQSEFQGEAYMLSTCFRCSPMILGAAQKLIEHNTFRISKDMKSSKKEQGKVEIRAMPNTYKSPFTTLLEKRVDANEQPLPPFMQTQPIESYRYIVDCIEEDKDGLAVLARTNKQLDCLEFCLSERGIATERIGGRSIFDNPAIIGYAQLLIGFVFTKELHSLIDGLGWLGVCDDELNNLQSIRNNHDPLFTFGELSGVDVVQELAQFRNQCLFSKPSTSEICYRLKCIIDAYLVKTADPMQNSRMAAVSVVNNILTKVDQPFSKRVKSLADFLRKSANKSKGEHRVKDKVVLCTMTSAKGLEWPKVLLMMLDKNVIPSMHITKSDVEGLEEERRLLYVAMTRAEEKLILQYSQASPSVFIKDDLDIN